MFLVKNGGFIGFVKSPIISYTVGTSVASNGKTVINYPVTGTFGVNGFTTPIGFGSIETIDKISGYDSRTYAGSSIDIDYFLCGGGGQGANCALTSGIGAGAGGGGGGGAVIELFDQTISSSFSDNVIVGISTGRGDLSSGAAGIPGYPTSFNGTIAIGGGGGGNYNNNGTNGGSGGGNATSTVQLGIPGQGNNGGNGPNLANSGAGGGGGTSFPGGNGTISNGGNGGTPYLSQINGSYFGGGGGGGAKVAFIGSGVRGIGGGFLGGNGGDESNLPTDAVAGTGSGGGGAFSGPTPNAGYAGSSGFCSIRYQRVVLS